MPGFPASKTAQYAGNVIVNLKSTPYSWPWHTDGWNSFVWSNKSVRPFFSGWANPFGSPIAPQYPPSLFYSLRPGQTSFDKVFVGPLSGNFFTPGILVNDYAYFYTDNGPVPQQYYYNYFFPQGSGINTTRINKNVVSNNQTGTFGQGEIVSLCAPGLGPIAFEQYSKTIVGPSAYPSNQTNGRVAWGFQPILANNSSPYTFTQLFSGVSATAFNADQRFGINYYWLGTATARPTPHLIKEDLNTQLVSYWNISLDRADLNAKWNSASSGSGIQACSVGWTCTLDVAGYGKYNDIVIVLDFDMSNYWTVQFVAQDAATDTALSAATIGGVLWQTKLDIDGNFYVNSAQVFSSPNVLMTGHIAFPWQLQVPNSTFALPCFDPCSFGDT